MGIKQNYLYRVLPGLEKDGKVVKRDRGWHAKLSASPSDSLCGGGTRGARSHAPARATARHA